MWPTATTDPGGSRRRRRPERRRLRSLRRRSLRALGGRRPYAALPLRHGQSLLESVDDRELVSVGLRSVVTYQADGWAALADPTRRTIFERVADRPRAVGELASGLPVTRPAVSQHLKVLKEAGLVVDRPEGNR